MRVLFLRYALLEARKVSVSKAEIPGGMTLTDIFIAALPKEHENGGILELTAQPDYEGLNDRDSLVIYLDNKTLDEKASRLVHKVSRLEGEVNLLREDARKATALRALLLKLQQRPAYGA